MNPFDELGCGKAAPDGPAPDDLSTDDLSVDDLTDDDARFDRLVDGELSAAERRRLLAALDDEPGGWRRCAMAFLEAQAWREGLSDLRQQVGVLSQHGERDAAAGQRHNIASATNEQAAGITTANAPLPAASHRSSLLGLALAMAACILIAFFLGSEYRRRSSPGPAQMAQQPSPAVSASSDAPPSHPAARDDAVAPGDAAPSEVMDESGQAPPHEIEDSPPTNQFIPWGEATFVTDGSEGREVGVPVFDLDPAARQLLLESSTAALDDLRRQLQRSGFDVRRTVRWSQVPIGNDRHMLVPVGDFEISLASHRPVQ